MLKRRLYDCLIITTSGKTHRIKCGVIHSVAESIRKDLEWQYTWANGLECEGLCFWTDYSRRKPKDYKVKSVVLVKRLVNY